MPQDPVGRPGPQQVDVLDAVAARDQRVDQAQQLAARRYPRVTISSGGLLESEPTDQSAGQQQPSVSDRVVVVEAQIDAVKAVRRWHPEGASVAAVRLV